VVFDAHDKLALLFFLFTYHDAFQLRSLEVVFIVFVGPFLVDSFGGTVLSSDSLGYESCMLDNMVHTPKDDDRLWRLKRHLGGPHIVIKLA
jgi:hypothetical protein